MTRTENTHAIDDVMEVFEAPLNDTEEYGVYMEEPHAYMYSRGRRRMVMEDRRQDHPILRAYRARQRYARLLLADAEGRRRRNANQSSPLTAMPRRRGHGEAVPVDDGDDTDSEDEEWTISSLKQELAAIRQQEIGGEGEEDDDVGTIAEDKIGNDERVISILQRQHVAAPRDDNDDDQWTVSILKRELAAVMMASEMQHMRSAAMADSHGDAGAGSWRRQKFRRGDSTDAIWDAERKMNFAAGVSALRRRQDPARDKGSISLNRSGSWKDFFNSSWRSLEDECMASSLDSTY